jgi:carbamoyltransferase
LHVPSAPADDGNAIGAALLAHVEDHADSMPPRRPMSPYLGSRIKSETMARIAEWEPRLKHFGDAIVAETAKLLAAGKIVGWVQGRAEFGPRALGNRSIFADPRPAKAKDMLNAKVKLRERFRPFAPSILAEQPRLTWSARYGSVPRSGRAFRRWFTSTAPAGCRR